MEDLEDYTAVFFQECDELLDVLEERFAPLADGTGDEETVHAAFRAVHSIKGGADAFGYGELVAFAHVLEAVMDAIRSDRVSVTQDICVSLIRGRDVLFDLVERARNGDTSPLPAAAAMAEELSAVNGGLRGGGTASETASAEAAPARSGAAEPDPADRPGHVTDLGKERACRIRFTPGPDFQTSGHDPLRLIRALRGLGTLQVKPGGDIPPLDDFDPNICPLAWEFDLGTDSGHDALNDFFEIYRATAEIEVTPVGKDGLPIPASAETPPTAQESGDDASDAEPPPGSGGLAR